MTDKKIPEPAETLPEVDSAQTERPPARQRYLYWLHAERLSDAEEFYADSDEEAERYVEEELSGPDDGKATLFKLVSVVEW